MKINILLPFPPRKPAGGTRVMYEYANQLAILGHKVTFYHPIKVPYINAKKLYKIKKIYFSIFRPPTWFKLNEKIKSLVIPALENDFISDGDVLFFTWWSLAFETQKLSISKGIKYNLVQDLEFWNGYEDKVYQSYSFTNINNVVISEHIRKFIAPYSPNPVEKLSPAIDDKKYSITSPLQNRNNTSLCMMYSEEPRKGSIYGIEAIIKAKEKIPSLTATFFSTYKKPDNLPHFIKFINNPPRLQDIYNNAAIFVGPSLQEGCALPPMEAMMCGCAVICTDIEGHSEYAFANETVMSTPVKEAEAMAEKIVLLANNPEARIKLAEAGNKFIKKFTWQQSAKTLNDIWEKTLQKTNKAKG